MGREIGGVVQAFVDPAERDHGHVKAQTKELSN